MIDIKQIINKSDKYNFHSHTQFCDGRDNMENILLSAIDHGFTDWGFSPHSPVPLESPCNMNDADLRPYFSEIDRLREKYGNRINIYRSIEIDYLGDWGPSNDYFQEMDLDYRIGSVHFIPSFAKEGYVDIDGCFENFKPKMADHFYNDIEGVVLSFYTQTMDMIEKGGFDIIGHFDKIGNNASVFSPGIDKQDWYKSLVRETFDAIMDHGYWIEINTKAYDKSGIFFPHQQFWHLLKKYDAPVVFNSDAHFPELVNAGRAEAMMMFKELKSIAETE